MAETPLPPPPETPAPPSASVSVAARASRPSRLSIVVPATHVLDAAFSPENSAPQRRALGWLALLAGLALIRLAMPVGSGLLLGALFGFTLQPAYERLRERGYKATVASLICALGGSFGLAAAAFGLGYLVIRRGLAIIVLLPEALGPHGRVRALASRFEPLLQRLHLSSDDLASRARDEAASAVERFAGIAGRVADTTFSSLLTFFFTVMTSYFVLRHWNNLVTQAELTMPLHPKHTHALLDEFRIVGRRVLLGTILTGLAQGLFAGLGYWFTGAPEPALFGAITALASLVPAVGTLLVWVPMGLYLVSTGHVGAGILELIWGAVIVGITTDYVIRPKLVGSDDAVPTLLTFIALFGGVEVFGLIGLILGPVTVAVAVALLRTYQAEVRVIRQSLVPPQPVVEAADDE
jgi:predicted PurR-regulated permease PerM